MKKYYMMILAVALTISGCSDFLDRDPDDYIGGEMVYGDEKLASAAVANLYGRVYWGQNIDQDKLYIYLDEACLSSGSPDNTYGFSNEFMRVYEYSLLRDMNILLQGFRSKAGEALGKALRTRLEGEIRFLRAWTYFNMARSLGGMPLIGDNVFEYTSGMDVSTLQFPRSSEAGIYDYVISECEDVARNFLGEEPSVNGARAIKWTALALKARAALYAGSIARYNARMATPLQTPQGSVGIPAEKDTYYYDIALKAAQEIIASHKYELYELNSDKRRNFYEATSVKNGNKEVIWTFDHIYPGSVTMFSANNFPTSHAEEESSTNITPILNLVEAFEYVDNRDGSLRLTDCDGRSVVYDNAADLFADKDPRLWGTVIYPGSELKGEPVVFQAGRVSPGDSGNWNYEVGGAGSTDPDGELITSVNGPSTTNDGQRNKSGFCIRKFIDETSKASTRQGSGMWFINFRYAEILLIAAEAAFELGDDTALGYINEVRDRAGIQQLKTLTLDDIVRERRVEFAFENHRYWDLKRWRKAHLLWNGSETNPDAVHYALFPYKINAPGDPDDGKWIFERKATHMTMYPRLFEMRNYYNFLSQEWLSNNPKLEKNPYQ